MSLKNILSTLLSMALIAGLMFYFGGDFATPTDNSGKPSTHSKKPNKSGKYDRNDPSQPKAPKKDAAILDDMQDHRLIYTNHAKCRMDCRTISKAEVNDILEEGHINWRKSEPDDPRGCPTYAVEGNTDDGQEVRIVFAACDDVTKVITTIDLGNEYKCYCK